MSLKSRWRAGWEIENHWKNHDHEYLHIPGGLGRVGDRSGRGAGHRLGAPVMDCQDKYLYLMNEFEVMRALDAAKESKA